MHKCRTVGELKEALEHFQDDIPLHSTGPDSGGYDVVSKTEVVVYLWSGGLYVGGDDESTKDGKIDYEI